MSADSIPFSGAAKWLSPPQASAYLGGIAVDTLAHWRAKKTGPQFTRFGRRIRYSCDDLDAFMRSHSQL